MKTAICILFLSATLATSGVSGYSYNRVGAFGYDWNLGLNGFKLDNRGVFGFNWDNQGSKSLSFR